jgi:hypothetical protein
MNLIKIGMMVCKEWKAGYCRNKSKEEEPWKRGKNSRAGTGDNINLDGRR